MTHVFEAAGLGQAPFFLASYSCESNSCHFCGTYIKHNYHIQDANGKRFVVGSECVLKTGDNGLMNDVKTHRSALAKQARKAKNEQKFADRVAARKAQQAAWDEADVQTFQSGTMPFGKFKGALVTAVPYSYLKYMAGYLKESKVKEAIAAHVASMVDPDVFSTDFAGYVGERKTFVAKLDRVATYEAPGFYYGQTQTGYILTFRTKKNECVVYKTTSNPCFFKENIGTMYTFTARIKDHSVYNGQNQTVIQRMTKIDLFEEVEA